MNKENKETDPLATERDLTGKTFVRRRDVGKVVPPEAMEPRNIKVEISIKLDADIIEYFKDRAKQLGVPPYQTLINQALREVIEREREGFPGESLIRDDRFVEAITERIKARL
jgi:uncharacterized protein (DUF4415 family)